jgi:8-oxo-dGTP diphosphatase
VDDELRDTPSGSASFYAALPTKQVAVGCLFFDDVGRVLIVKPTYKDGWELPGGVVEENESPLDACGREVAEELGLDRLPTRLLGVDYRTAVDGVRGDALRFVFLGGVLTATDVSAIRLAAAELSEWRFAAVDELDGMLIPVAARRVRALLDEGAVGYLEEGSRPSAMTNE